MPPVVSVKVWGEFALFTRPELKVERVSYPLMTPSAARGVLDAILWKPQMRWHVRRVVALRPVFPLGFPTDEAKEPYRLVAIRRNEIADKISTAKATGWAADPTRCTPYRVDENRTQRNSLVLHHVAYRIDASPVLTMKPDGQRNRLEEEDDRGPDTVAKYVGMFQRRVEKGQCFHRPYLGCREFACHFAPPSDADEPLADWNLDLGLMLYDIKFGGRGNCPGFFLAEVREGVLHCDTEHPGPGGQQKVNVLGWDEEGGAA
jgi:CRISPR-associated protein Cas5d